MHYKDDLLTISQVYAEAAQARDYSAAARMLKRQLVAAFLASRLERFGLSHAGHDLILDRKRWEDGGVWVHITCTPHTPEPPIPIRELTTENMIEAHAEKEEGDPLNPPAAGYFPAVEAAAAAALAATRQQLEQMASDFELNPPDELNPPEEPKP